MYTPQFYCLKNLCSFRLPLHHFFKWSPSRTRSFLRSLRSKHSASGRTIWANARHQTVCHGVTGTSLQGLQMMGQSRYIETRGQRLQSESAWYPPASTPFSPGRDSFSGCQVALRKGPWHLCVYKVRLQVPLPLHIDDASTRACVAKCLQDDACLLSHLQATGTDTNRLLPKPVKPLQRGSLFPSPRIPFLRN